MCGIFGHFPKNGKRANVLKVKLLGLDNVERGKDSCGYYYGGIVKKGVEKEKEFDKYIEENFLEKGDLYPLFLGHTRSASPGILGGYSAFNAHPFECGELILTHNGVIYNIMELAEKYNVDVTGLNVDSHKLAQIISQAGLNVLHDYVGAAALAFTFKNEPNVGYIYHGRSNEKSVLQTAVDGKICYEERPLYWMQTEEGVFYSSKREGLLRIRENEDEYPYNLEYNTVYKVVDGVLIDDPAEVFTVNRIDNNLRIDECRTKSYQSNFFPNRGGQTSAATNTRVYSNTSFSKNKSNLAVAYSSVATPEISLILTEQLPARAKVKTNICFYWKGRHWLKKENADKTYNHELADGVVFLDKKGFISREGSTGVRKYYFYQGVMIKDKITYERLMTDLEHKSLFNKFIKQPTANFAYWIADYAEYPVTCLQSEGTGVEVARDRLRFFKSTSGEQLKGDEKLFTPKFSSRSYRTNGLFLIGITSSDKNDKEIFEFDEDSPNDVTDFSDPDDTDIDTIFNSGYKNGLQEAFKERKDAVRLLFNATVFDSMDLVFDNKDAIGMLELLIIELFLLDYNQFLEDPREIDYYVRKFLGECVDSGITIMENCPKDYDLEKYLVKYFDEMFDELLDAGKKKQ